MTKRQYPVNLTYEDLRTIQVALGWIPYPDECSDALHDKFSSLADAVAELEPLEGYL